MTSPRDSASPWIRASEDAIAWIGVERGVRTACTEGQGAERICILRVGV